MLRFFAVFLSMHVNSETVPPLGYNHFLPNYSAIVLRSDAWGADKTAKRRSDEV
jgi:hypothetical protein